MPPPPPDRLHRQLGRIRIDSHADPAGVGRLIVAATSGRHGSRDRPGFPGPVRGADHASPAAYVPRLDGVTAQGESASPSLEPGARVPASLPGRSPVTALSLRPPG